MVTKVIARGVALFLLLFNGIAAIFGGWQLIAHPDGSSIKLSLDYISGSPFDNYLLPGVMLFISNGVFGFFVLFCTLGEIKNYPRLILIQGIILFAWILVQILMVREINSLHIALGSIGILLILSGRILMRSKHNHH